VSLKKLIFSIIIILTILFSAVILPPSPISPQAYSPPTPQDLSGVLAANKLLQQAEILAVGKINGPEEVAVDSQGRIYGGTQDGKIMILTPDGKLEVFAETHGRPLGMQFNKNQNLIVCDAAKGLLSIDPQGKITILATSANDISLKFTDALDISSDGIVYFTDASAKYGQNEYLYDLLESKPHGRLLSYDLATG
jgi:sugar lactone lactonase YvrE